jgi:hypothetical protein
VTETRLRGQEVSVRLARGGITEATLTAIKDLTIQFDFATIEEGYLGETVMRKDDIFNGVSGSLTMDSEGQEQFQFINFLVRRAQRAEDTPVNQSRVNATARFTFPNGQVPRIVVRDMKFDAVPLAVPSRDAYVNATFPYKAETARILAA